MIKDIPGYEGLYAVDDSGNVYSYKCGRTKMLKLNNNGNGYYIVTLTKDGYQKSFKVHRLVVKTFLPDYKESLDVDHIDRNRLNNNLSNLRMLTHQENMFNQNAKGFGWHKNKKKFQAKITINGKQKHLGYFDTEAEAKQAYLDAKAIYHIMPS